MWSTMASRASSFSFTLSLLLWFCVLIAAQETATQLPTSTPLPDGHRQATVGWVDNPKRRGTTTLLIECLTTIFACTWTVLHLNVPAITDSTTTRVLRKAKWMAITILFPEFIFAKAVCELRFALEMLNRMYLSNHSRFETVSEVKIEDGRSARVLWAWTVEFELLKRILYGLLLWEKPYRWAYKASFFRSHASTPNGLRMISRRTELDKDVKEKFIEKSFSEKDRHFNGIPIARVHKWTLTHAYYANMGGIVARKRMQEWIDDKATSSLFFTHSYSVIRGDQLAQSAMRRKRWELGHPLKELRLSADDIKDKSKADWIVKIIAVFQIARLIFDLVTRGVGGQPVTQLEVATASFSIFAIVTYFANWWKPKDISQPTRLDTVVDQGTRGDPVERETEPFFARLWSPTPPAHYYEDTMSPRVRIPNDELWVGRTSGYRQLPRSHSNPLAWSLMATSCLVFGGIHCIAWSFQFPTQVEELTWRIAALVSTTLPVIALAGSFAILRYRPRDLKRRQKKAVNETYHLYNYDDRGMYVGLDRRLLDMNWWDTFTTAVNTSEWDNWVRTHAEQGIPLIREMGRLRWELEMLSKLRRLIWEIQLASGYGRYGEKVINSFWDISRRLKISGGQDLALRGQYEKWLRDTHALPNANIRGESYAGPGPEGVFQLVFSRCAREPASVQLYQEARKDFDIRAQRFSRLFNIICGIIYTAARLVLLAIMFSSLRAVRDGVYDTANWTRFVPSFS